MQSNEISEAHAGTFTMIFAFSIVVILAVAYSQYSNGLFHAVAMLVAVLLSGLMAFNLWEPAADVLELSLQRGSLAGCEDMLALTLIFGVTLFLLRLAIFNYLAPELIEQHGHLQFLGAGAVGLLTGYLVTGFLVCVMETLPLDEHFLGFEPRSDAEGALRSFLPPDRVWLAMMRQAGRSSFSWKEDPTPPEPSDRFLTFDRYGTFEMRYARYRRNTEARGPMPYMGEFDRELYGGAKAR